jgi:phosphatidylserine decarboxylase
MNPSSFTDRLFALPQHLLPHHPLSRLAHYLTRCQHPAVKDFLIRKFIDLYQVDMSEVENPDPDSYPHFNAFFTRALKANARPIPHQENAVLCPADGAISQIGYIDGESIIQAKGMSFSVNSLMGGDANRAEPFHFGSFATIYLSPRDYHRLHMPVSGRLKQMIHVPGRLFSVNANTTRVVPELFARNERVIAIFETDLGPMALILVGAIFVASIETVWHGVVTPPTRPDITLWDYSNESIFLERGSEMGRFNMGSTIIVSFGKNSVNWTDGLHAAMPVRMGELLGSGHTK